MLGAAFLFALMAVCVKLAASRYGAAEIVMYRSLFGAGFIALWVRWRGGSLRSAVPAMHAWRAAVGVAALLLWFQAIAAGLPLATAMTLNYMSSVWMALFLLVAAAWSGRSRLRLDGRLDGRLDRRLLAAVLVGMAGVALALRPSLARDQLAPALAGLASGICAALAYLQVRALGRIGEPDYRVVFYFCVGGVGVGALLALGQGGFARHDARGAGLLLAIGTLATVAQLMITRAYAIGSALVNASLNYSGIGFAFAFGVLWFGETVSVGTLAGIALIVGAGLAATLLRARETTAGVGVD
jgi:S-adenosylmethionine uptake transporter